MSSIIDLTGSDDEAPRETGRPRPASTFPVNASPRSTSNVSRSPVPGARVSSTQKPLDSPSRRRPIFSPPKKDQPIGSRSSLNSGSQQATRLSTSQSQQSPESRATPRSTNESSTQPQGSQQARATPRAATDSFKVATQSSQAPISIDSDSEAEQSRRRPPREFVMPRGVGTNGTTQSSVKTGSGLSSFTENGNTSRKRPLEQESSPNNGGRSKRPRLEDRTVTGAFNSQNRPGTNSQPKPANGDQPIVISPQRPRISDIKESFDLTSEAISPIGERRQRAPPNDRVSSSSKKQQPDKSPCPAASDEPGTRTPSTQSNGRSRLRDTFVLGTPSDRTNNGPSYTGSQSNRSSLLTGDQPSALRDRHVSSAIRDRSRRTSEPRPMLSTVATSQSSLRSTRAPSAKDLEIPRSNGESKMPIRPTRSPSAAEGESNLASHEVRRQQQTSAGTVRAHTDDVNITESSHELPQPASQGPAISPAALRRDGALRHDDPNAAARSDAETGKHGTSRRTEHSEQAAMLNAADSTSINPHSTQLSKRNELQNGQRHSVEKDRSRATRPAKSPQKRTESVTATPKRQRSAALAQNSNLTGPSPPKVNSDLSRQHKRSSQVRESKESTTQDNTTLQEGGKAHRSDESQEQLGEVDAAQRHSADTAWLAPVTLDACLSEDNSHSKAVSPEKSLSDAERADFQLQSEAMQSIENAGNSDDAELTLAPSAAAASVSQISAMYSALSLTNRVEKVLGKYLEELRGDNEYWTSSSLKRARLRKENRTDGSFVARRGEAPQEAASFFHLEPLDFSQHAKANSSNKADSEIWHTQRMASDAKPMALVERAPSYVKFASAQFDVPDYAHYVSIQQNILAPNVVHLHCWPYFGDDFDLNNAENLGQQYNMDIRDRERKLLLLQKAQKCEPYVESALRNIECSWSDVLRYLLEESPNVGTDPGALKALQNRQQVCAADFSRDSYRWQRVLASLPPSSTEQLSRAAVLCENFQKMAKFSIWHIARRSQLAEPPQPGNEIVAARPSDNSMTCRVCLRFNCPYHGHFRHREDNEGSDSEADSISTVDTVVATDVVHPIKANYRSRVAFPKANETAPEPIITAPPRRKKGYSQKNSDYWADYTHKAEERGPFYPCDHPGQSCKEANCRCVQRNIPCEKTCSCPVNCLHKFKGCSCALKKGHGLVCLQDPDCACWQLGRECDPDLCGTCGVCDVLDPINEMNDGILAGRCRNASIQRGVPKHTLLGDSGVHGLGLYACELIRANEFVGEYKGEVINKREADRRGAVYEHQKLSYLFSLNKAQEIDSTYFGNKMRFINHAHGQKANLYPRIIAVNTVHRIGLYAERDIAVGKELLFDYGPYFPDEQLQGKKSKKSAPESKKSAPHVRNANLVKAFYDVEESEDDDGILRAKAVGSGTTRPRKGIAMVKKTRGGARPGAGRKPKQASNPGPTRAATPPAPPPAPALTDSPESTRGPNAAERLSAYNISDDTYSTGMDVDADVGADDDDVFESPEASETDDSDQSDADRTSEFEDEDDQPGLERSSRRRDGVETRRFNRR